jgi:hypothetical protein
MTNCAKLVGFKEQKIFLTTNWLSILQVLQGLIKYTNFCCFGPSILQRENT